MNSFAARSDKIVLYPSPGKCIYCKLSDRMLTDEHIIAYSFGGLLILQKSSCMVCAEITGKFEGVVARSQFGDFRIKHKFPTRRKKDRPTHVEIKTNGLGVSKSLVISREEFPAPAFMYKCTPAGILQGHSPQLDGSSSWQMVGVVSDEEMKSFLLKYGQDTIFEFRHLPEHFARMLAKIAHSYAVANLGVDVFRHLTTDIILGKTNNFSYFVGGSLDILPPVPDAGHLLSINMKTDFVTALVIVEIRLFASATTPHYHVVVGTTDNVSDTRRLLEIGRKLRLIN